MATASYKPSPIGITPITTGVTNGAPWGPMQVAQRRRGVAVKPPVINPQGGQGVMGVSTTWRPPWDPYIQPPSGFDPTGGGSVGTGIGTQFGPNTGAPGAAACTIAGLPANCTYSELAVAALNRLTGGSEPASGDPPVPGTGSGGSCTFPAIRVGNQCVDATAAFPGGDPMMYSAPGTPVAGMYGVGYAPTAEQRMVRRCPPGTKLGKDGVCYSHIARSNRMWNPGHKPLLTGGEMAAIAKAKRAAGRLNRAQKGLKKAARALEKAC